jgi:cytochrome c-type biogenesis protein CcsB
MTLLFNLSLAAYFAALVCSVVNLMSRRRLSGVAADLLILAGGLIQTVYLGVRWAQAGRAPFSNMFESLVLFAWTVAVVYLVLRTRVNIPWLAAASAALSALALAHASTFESDIRPLMPALQSNWLTFHVMTCFLGYGAFAVSFLVGIGYLVASKDVVFKWSWRAATLGAAVIAFAIGGRFALLGHGAVAAVFYGAIAAGLIVEIGHGVVSRSAVQPATRETLDTIMSQTISFGFLFLTLGVLTGAVWANSAWGTYWSWDPKETWSLITWFIYAVFLHCRFVRGWRGRRAAWISIIGFASVLFTYFGVNFLLSGLHSYGSK